MHPLEHHYYAGPMAINSPLGRAYVIKILQMYGKQQKATYGKAAMQEDARIHIELGQWKFKCHK